jgi:hypothetical protein
MQLWGGAEHLLARVNKAMVKCLFVANRRCIQKGVLGIPTGKHPEDSVVPDMEAKLRSSTTYPRHVTRITEIISHSAALVS